MGMKGYDISGLRVLESNYDVNYSGNKNLF